MNNFKTNIFKTITEDVTPIIGCNEIPQSGGVGVTEYVILLDKPEGGIVIIDFDAQGVPDKLEIIHNNIKKATSGMTTVNEGPFDNLYGDPTIPNSSQASSTDQFIGTSKGLIPTRDSEFLSNTGINDITRTKQQLIWWVYSSADYDMLNNVVIRVTGINGTAWSLKRLCTNQIPITPPTYTVNYLISQCNTGDLYNIDKNGVVLNIGDVIEFRPTGYTGTLPRCGTITSTTFNSVGADAILNSQVLRDCGDDIHCNI